MTNPETCRHNVLVADLSDNLVVVAICVSCKTDVSDPNRRIGKNYVYDSEHVVWVHTPIKRK